MSQDVDKCAECSCPLQRPFIRCAECDDVTELCLHCFARGCQPAPHRNDHGYEIVRDDFSVLSADWTAAEETRLLDTIATCGHGNWYDVAARVRRGVTECRKHYNRVYVENRSGEFETLRDHSGPTRFYPIVLRPSDAPPRPGENVSTQHDLYGYSAARSDFAVEHDNFAELIVAQLEFEGDMDPLLHDLQQAVLDMYRRVLLERRRRRAVVRAHGLVHFRRHFVHDRKFYPTLGGHVVDAMRVLSGHMSAEQWDTMMEALHYAPQLRKQISQLKECRREGITRLRCARIYSELKRSRDQQVNSRHLLDDTLTALQKEQWMTRQEMLGNVINGVPSILPQLVKREMRPLEISCLPGYEKLNEKEREFCAQARLVPTQFIHFRCTLVSEHDKHGALKLALARTLLKIDVNKTRRIFDFLVEQGVITKDTGKR